MEAVIVLYPGDSLTTHYPQLHCHRWSPGPPFERPECDLRQSTMIGDSYLLRATSVGAPDVLLKTPSKPMNVHLVKPLIEKLAVAKHASYCKASVTKPSKAKLPVPTLASSKETAILSAVFVDCPRNITICECDSIS